MSGRAVSTGLTAAALWRAFTPEPGRRRGGVHLGGFALSFVVAVGLHTAWDIAHGDRALSAGRSPAARFLTS